MSIWLGFCSGISSMEILVGVGWKVRQFFLTSSCRFNVALYVFYYPFYTILLLIIQRKKLRINGRNN
jgi:hypothetical protein